MDIEQQIEDLCLDKAQQEAIVDGCRICNKLGKKIKELAVIDKEKQIALAKIQGIDSRLEELRNKLAKNYKARNQGALHNKDSNGQNTVYEYTV